MKNWHVKSQKIFFLKILIRFRINVAQVKPIRIHNKVLIVSSIICLADLMFAYVKRTAF